MRSRIVATLSIAALVTGCAPKSAVRRYFADAGLSYPLHLTLPSRDNPRLVCPGCDEPERLAPEYRALLASGRSFLTTHLSAEFLRPLTGAEAFRVTDAYLFEDPPGGPVGLAVQLSAFERSGGENREVFMPHERHTTRSGSVLETRNILVLRSTGRGWEYSSWVY